MLQIEWKSSHYHSDGRRRRHPKASTVHGWLVKWRATFSGNERLRKEGIREMHEARVARERKKQQKRQSKASKELSRRSQHSSSKHPRRGSTRRSTSQNHSPRPTLANSRRPGHNRKATGDRNPPSSRKASYNSGRRTKRSLTAPT